MFSLDTEMVIKEAIEKALLNDGYSLTTVDLRVSIERGHVEIEEFKEESEVLVTSLQNDIYDLRMLLEEINAISNY